MNLQYYLCIFFFSLIHVRDCRCYIWTYALSQSLSEGAYEDQVYHPRNIHQNADEPLQAAAGDENHTKRDWTPCEGDRSCPHGRFCDRHYGICERLRGEGEFCRRDGHCHRQHECVFGRCRVAVQLPDLGTKCSCDDDCGEGRCCAKQHGEFVCKNRPRQGHMCFVPKGGLAYSLNQICPCEEGLVCMNVASQRKKGFSRISWKHLEQMRCVLPYTVEEEQEEILERVIVSRRHQPELRPRENSKESQTESVSSEVGMLLVITTSFMLR